MVPAHLIPLVAGNWKMNGSVAANAVLLEGLRAGATGLAADLAVCVPAPYLAQAQSALSGSVVAWGGQAVIVQPSLLHQRIAELALKHRLPAELGAVKSALQQRLSR